jgi:hypothetical protein
VISLLKARRTSPSQVGDVLDRERGAVRLAVFCRDSDRFELGGLDSDGADIPVPPHEHAHRVTEGFADHESLEVRNVLDRMNVYLEDDVASIERSGISRIASS